MESFSIDPLSCKPEPGCTLASILCFICLQEDPFHLTDLPDSDDENDPVSLMCWPPKDRGDITDDGGNIIDAK